MPEFSDEALLIRGGQGEVWKARDEHGRHVAIKRLILGKDPTKHAVARDRFRREVACQSTLLHDSIVEVLYSDLDADVPYFVMPLADGSLSELLRMNVDGLAFEDALTLFTAVVDGMAYAHAQGIIHRDLKPGNILLYGAKPRVSDFGLGRRTDGPSASLTRVGQALGTPWYMAPEQRVDTHSVDASADVFSLGYIFYEVLTGQRAAGGIDYSRVPARYQYLLRMATQLDSSQRFQSATELLRELTVAAGDPAVVEPAKQLAVLLDQAIQGEDRADDIFRLLYAHAGDLDLFVNALASAPRTVIESLATRISDFDWLVREFDRLADGEFASNAVDRIAYFLLAVSEVVADDALQMLALERLLVLSHHHERLYARDRFIDSLRSAMRQPSLTGPIGEMLRRHPAAIPFIRSNVLELEPPPELIRAVT